MGIHYAKFENSPRLQRVARVLAVGGWMSTREIRNKADVCATSEAICELRKNGFEIHTRQVTRGRFEYYLIGRKMEQGSLKFEV